MRPRRSAWQLVAQQRQAQGLGAAHQTRQQPGAAGVGHQADLGESLDEAGRARGQHQVARERQVGTRACGDAIDGGQHRDGHAADAQAQGAVELVDHAAQVLGCGAGREVGRHGRVGQVLAGAEGPARACEYHAAHVGVGGGGFERGQQLGMQLGREAVERCGPVERQRLHGARLRHKDQGFRHGCSCLSRWGKPVLIDRKHY
jgi:hypothetical protein